MSTCGAVGVHKVGCRSPFLPPSFPRDGRAHSAFRLQTEQNRFRCSSVSCNAAGNSATPPERHGRGEPMRPCLITPQIDSSSLTQIGPLNVTGGVIKAHRAAARFFRGLCASEAASLHPYGSRYLTFGRGLTFQYMTCVCVVFKRRKFIAVARRRYPICCRSLTLLL